MEQIPDAPWIRDAENNGVGPFDQPICPICGEECETIYADMYGNVFACDQCLIEQDAWQWQEDQREADRDGQV